MRGLVLLCGAAALLCSPVAGATVGARSLVLRQADVPRGFRLVEQQSGPWTNAMVAEGAARYRRQVVRSGRISGYASVWERRSRTTIEIVSSRSDLCREPAGARRWLAWIEASAKRLNAQLGASLFAREPVRLGAGGWMYRRKSGVQDVLVAWRHERAVGLLMTWGLDAREALRLARVQQRRMAAGLR